MNLLTCKNPECMDEYDEHGTEKRRAGGLRTLCPRCSKETAVKHLGCGVSDGKGNNVEILSFKDPKQREAYRIWRRANSGMFRGAVCQMGGNGPPPAVQYERVYVPGDMNHKGKK